MSDYLEIAGKKFSSRLMIGTGRHRTMDEMIASIESSGTEIITIAIGRLNLDNPNEKSILDYFDWQKYTILPNTAGCKNEDEAVFVAKLAREVTGSDWVKLEVIPDPAHLLPDPIGTYNAAKTLVGLADKMRCKKGLPAREKKTGLFDSINIFKKKEANQQEFDKPCNEYSTKTLVSLSKRMMCKKSKKNN